MKRVTLELTLKPFRNLSDRDIQRVCTQITRQWIHLIEDAEELAFLFWVADGSEILDYSGCLDDEIEWARYVGVANPPEEYPEDPRRQSIAAWPRLYTENPMRVTYADLKRALSQMRAVAAELTGKSVSIGAIFDPGPEFAKSSFKYVRHPEIVTGKTMGDGTWVSCGARLRGDTQAYAGFPEGIPEEGMTMGRFLGRQAQCFLSDLGYDYLWLSNGFGFALSAWHVTGDLFDGRSFYPEKAVANRESILRFWSEFREECPHYRIEARGSNFSAGMDLSSDGCPLLDIYTREDNLVAPPNSPWAAMDGDYGLEIVGYLSRLSLLPANGNITWRYYLHDPWFLNSPWIDRYGREPHDIYMPLALARLDARGEVTPISNLSFLTVDNSWGELPRQCPIEVVPHVQEALRHRPDEPGPVVWVYPFSEYHAKTFSEEESDLPSVFFGDWFMRAAVNHGFPLGSVIASDNFIHAWENNPERFRSSILLCPAGLGNCELEAALLQAVEDGYRVLLYGPVTRACPELLSALNLRMDTPLAGELELNGQRICHRTDLCGGGVDTVMDEDAAEGWKALAVVEQEGRQRIYAASRSYASGGMLVWVRGTFSATVTDDKLPVSDDESRWWHAERLLRESLEEFGYSLKVEKPSAQLRDPVFVTASSRNALYFSGYQPSVLVSWKLRFPLGAPLLTGCDAWIEDGHARYQMPRSWHRECRVYIRQLQDGPVSCVEQWSGEVGIRKRILVSGLRDANVVFFVDQDTDFDRLRLVANDPWPYVGDTLPYTISEDRRYVEIENITGSLLISW